MPQTRAAQTSAAMLATRTQRLRHRPAMRIRTPLLDRDNPVRPHVERQFLPEPFDEGVAVLVQEPDEGNRPLLGVTVGEGEGARALKLTPQRLVAALRRLNRLVLQVFEIVLHPAQRV